MLLYIQVYLFVCIGKAYDLGSLVAKWLHSSLTESLVASSLESFSSVSGCVLHDCWIISDQDIRWMEEPLHHLGWLKPCK